MCGRLKKKKQEYFNKRRIYEKIFNISARGDYDSYRD